MSLSSDEGEIRDDGNGDLKASPQTSRAGNGVDRQGRPRDPSPAPSRGSASSSRRSRSPRGFKRLRDDGDHYGGGRDYDSRPSRSRRDDRRGRDRGRRPSDSVYDDAPRHDYRRTRISYEDLDRPAPHGSSFNESRQYRDDADQHRRRDQDRDRNGHRPRDGGYGRQHDRYDNRRRDAYRDEQPRRRSRSPGMHRRDAGDHGRRDRENGAARPSLPLRTDSRTSEAPNSAAAETASNRMETTKEPSPEPDFQEPEPIDEDAEIERRRKRREELLAKSSSATPLLLHAVGAAADKAGNTASPASTQPEPRQQSLEARTPRTPGSDWPSPRSPASRDEPLDDKGLMNTHVNAEAAEPEGPSAADYDPTVDMQEDERRGELRHGQAVMHGEAQPVDAPHPESPKQRDSDDEEDDFDMFAEDFDEVKYAAQRAKAPDTRQVQGGILEGDDSEGFYKIRVGEILDSRYKVQSVLGQGMFARVARAVNQETKKVVAVKIIRNNAALRKGALTEIAILKKLNDGDPSNKKYIVRFEQSFDHQGHLCMVFEGLEMNLREVLKKFGKNVGINLEGTRRFARQIFVALDHMRKSSIIHADLKPDNILIHETRQFVKICDLGTAIDRDDAATAHSQVTPYLISRFYRAPEVILGMDYDYAIDVWSIGCTLFELFTGKILFPGENNNQMLKLMMELRGRMYPKYYKRGQMWPHHFDDRDNFVSVSRDKITNREVMKTMIVKPTRSLGSRLDDAASGMSAAEKQDLDRFRDLLENCLVLHPERRITAAEALQHSFFHNKRVATHPR
ncbi:U4/U6 small nuclear ribonucleoprotein prp4 [Purpureocillium lilacinum]|uniref:non-specific serine/threonine protein kinase n=1 Tax=Purpureocillium lilacinum TaxID=33203 RepID=A0A179FWP7_PURLI|nr:serine/threonine-protein kinase prp4 [Purpureocillium lilacinum]GJN83226.1 U4/U6 small nuclear ribonucleoprotein prp4 [Purpureocillium lilacinum]